MRLPRSIRSRLMLAFIALAAAVTAVFTAGMHRFAHNEWENYARPLAADYVDRLAAEIGNPPDPQRALALTQRLPITVRIEGPRVNWDSQPPGHHRTPPWAWVRRSADGHRIVFGLARAPDAERPARFGWALLAALLAVTALAYWAVARLLAPLRPIVAGVESFGRGEFGRPIAVARRDELGLLAERINGMAANLDAMLQAKRTLLLAISHELRSPLTRARVNAELIEESEARSALLQDLGEMRELITDLIESERLAQGHSALQAEPVDLAALARELVAGAFGGRGLRLDLEELGPVHADPARLRLLLRNLIDNALRHGGGAAAPEVFLRREADGRIALGVRDHGPGVGAEQIERLGQAFYRPDNARSRSEGGVGLGLHLCRLVAQAHGGELRIRRAEPGLEVSAVWPAPAA
ncbi:MAG: HAMP domain-containing histidine kinase [Burkholderiales bacterium]|nr:HAMP domain-containing histidine kinase [Burkholderiales bacterium]